MDLQNMLFKIYYYKIRITKVITILTLKPIVKHQSHRANSFLHDFHTWFNYSLPRGQLHYGFHFLKLRHNVYTVKCHTSIQLNEHSQSEYTLVPDTQMKT